MVFWFAVALMAAVALVPETVVMVNVPLVCPAATVIFAGTVATELLLDKVTTVPPVGAAAARVTVPVELLPPTTVLGFKTSVEGTIPL